MSMTMVEWEDASIGCETCDINCTIVEKMTYTLAIVARRTHSAALMSPSKASSAIHWMSSLRTSLMSGKRVEAGNALGTTVVGRDLVKRT